MIDRKHIPKENTATFKPLLAVKIFQIRIVYRNCVRSRCDRNSKIGSNQIDSRRGGNFRRFYSRRIYEWASIPSGLYLRAVHDEYFQVVSTGGAIVREQLPRLAFVAAISRGE